MTDRASHFRKANPAYIGKNGFFDRSSLISTESEDAMQIDGLPNPKFAAESKEAKRMRDLVENHRKIDEILNGRGSDFPGMDVVRAELATEDTAAHIKQRTDVLQAQFREQMDVIYDLIAEDYLGEVTDAYYSLDDSFSIPEIEHFCERLRRPDAPTLSPFFSLVSEVRYAHYRTLQDLLRKRGSRLASEEAARKTRDAQFPANVVAYHGIVNKGVQLRIARFLISDTPTKERMLTEFNWAWRQVKALEDEYSQNAVFKAEIQERVRELEVRDPRRKMSTTLAT